MNPSNRLPRRQTALTALLLLASACVSGCTGLQAWVGDVRDMGPAISQWGTDVFGDTSPEW